MATAAGSEREPSPMVSVPEAAWFLDVDEMTIHRLISQGILPAGRIVNGKRSVWRVPRALLVAFLAAVHAGAQVSLDDFAASWSTEAVS